MYIYIYSSDNKKPYSFFSVCMLNQNLGHNNHKCELHY